MQSSQHPQSQTQALFEAAANPGSPSPQALYRKLQATAAALGLTSQGPKPSPTQNSSVSIQAPYLAGRRSTVSVPRQEHAHLLQQHRINQIRYHQQVIARLAAMANPTIAADGSLVSLGLEARLAADDKTDGGFNATAFGLNPMSADDPSWIGHGFQAQAAEDFLSSPDWTDPSPALTDSMTFDLESCDPSPLLPMDSYDGEGAGVPGIAGAPLFSPQDGYASSNVSPFEAAHHDPSSAAAGDFGASEMGPDFTLFPEVRSSSTQERKLPAEMAFSKAPKAPAEDPAFTLLRALSSAALSGASVAAPVPAPVSSTPPVATSALTTSPLMLSTSVPTEEAKSSTEEVTAEARPEVVRRSSSTSTSPTTGSRGTKRRLDTTDLLPLDAPIQPRKYHTVSATSRRDTPVSAEEASFAADEEAIRREKDPRVAKRLSNTLAARRSRHRKAEELRQLHETIDSLRNEVEMWKKRCERAEQERDEARGL